MDLSTLKTDPGARRKRRRVGRGPGSGLGKTAGRGHKGQKSRSGYSHKHSFEGGQMPLSRRLPKRGFHHGKRCPFAVVNLDSLARCFDDGAQVTCESIVKAGLTGEAAGGVKLLGRGAIDKRLTVQVNAISESARKKIEAAGGSVEIVAVAAGKARAERPSEPSAEG